MNHDSKLINKYLSLKLTDKDNSGHICEDNNILKLLKTANKELEKYYTGSKRFNILMENEGLTPNNLKISPKKKRKIKEIWLKFDSELSKYQRQYEKFLQKSIEEGLQNDSDVLD